MSDNLSHEVIKISPPVGVSTLSVLGIPLSDMVYITTIIYILIQIVCTLYKTVKDTQKEGKEKKE